MGEHSEAFVGIDVAVAKGRNAIAVADGVCGGKVRYLGEVDASVANMTLLRLQDGFPVGTLLANGCPSGDVRMQPRIRVEMDLARSR